MLARHRGSASRPGKVQWGFPVMARGCAGSHGIYLENYMATTRSRFLTLCIASLGFIAASTAQVAAATVAAVRAACYCVMNAVTDGLKLFAPTDPVGKPLPVARTELTARERHDVGMWTWLRPVVARYWRGGAWA